MSKIEPKKLILIDGDAIIHRSYHALPPFTTKKGELVNAVYGFASTILSVIAKFRPEYIIATFDLSGPTFRHLEYADYKATRVKADEALYAQIPRVKELVKAFGIPICEAAGFEADDVIGTLAQKAKEMESALEIIIVTGDLDTLQLVNDRTKVYTLRRGLTDAVLYDQAEIFTRYSLLPEQLIDYKGLRGDPSDNIPGVKGVGEKTAIELLKTYGSLENVYAHLEEIKGALREKLEHDRLIAIKSKELATISREAPVTLDLEKAVTQEYDQVALFALFDELNFHSLKRRLEKNKQDFKQTDNGKSSTEKNRIQSQSTDGVKDFKFETATEKNATELFEYVSKTKELALRLDFDASANQLRGLAVAHKTGRVIYFSPTQTELFASLQKELQNPELTLIGHDLKSDLKRLKKAGLVLTEKLFDIEIGNYLLDPGRRTTLAEMIAENLHEELPEERKQGQLGLEIEAEEERVRKVSATADYLFKLKQIQAEKIKLLSVEQMRNGNDPKHTLANILEKLEMPLISILAEMEENGVRLDPLIFEGISAKITERITHLEKSIHKLAGADFNINSTKQLSEVLFEKMGLPTEGLKKGKSGAYSTASDELAKIPGQPKIIEKIEEYRELAKLKNTYLDTLPQLLDERLRLHTTFNQAITATGRLSSSDPNLQNIPIRTDLGQLLRTAFVAENGWKLVSADYSQIDLRVVAHVSQDGKMIALFQKGEDIHRATAAEIKKIPLSQVSEKIRRTAKELNFGIIYGMGAFGFAARTGISREEAKNFIDTYFEKFQGVAAYMRKIREFAKKNGYVETEIGRRRYLPEINSSNFQLQSTAERMAINMPIQGLAADIMKMAMLKIGAEFSENQSVRMILQIHDEIILEVREDLAESVSQRLKTLMENAYKLRVPLVANVEIGNNWGEI